LWVGIGLPLLLSPLPLLFIAEESVGGARVFFKVRFCDGYRVRRRRLGVRCTLVVVRIRDHRSKEEGIILRNNHKWSGIVDDNHNDSMRELWYLLRALVDDSLLLLLPLLSSLLALVGNSEIAEGVERGQPTMIAIDARIETNVRLGMVCVMCACFVLVCCGYDRELNYVQRLLVCLRLLWSFSIRSTYN